eukprot:TRINITY_DN12151_c0_g1_i1.p1 TRINITY_DN12151_c0_g1~~TRINITY_DN12151_c0_g1_i1.p1  ORF type:complete len:178 (-),score=14.34 TRINITY_DN12151_c0_g1_i1:41-574(-)
MQKTQSLNAAARSIAKIKAILNTRARSYYATPVTLVFTSARVEEWKRIKRLLKPSMWLSSGVLRSCRARLQNAKSLAATSKSELLPSIRREANIDKSVTLRATKIRINKKIALKNNKLIMTKKDMQAFPSKNQRAKSEVNIHKEGFSERKVLQENRNEHRSMAVSYTHLTLPTICSV